MTAPLSDKALRYIAALDQLRCEGQWLQVPELARKVEKHAPQRKTLVLVARSEATVSTTEVSDRQSALVGLIKPLSSAIAQEDSFPEDAFQASVCLAWIRWLLQDTQAVAGDLTDDFGHTAARITGKGALSVHWVEVCALKGAYLKGFSLEKTGKPVEAERAYHSAVAIVSSHSANSQDVPGREYRIWAERLLCRCVAQPMNAGHLDQSADFDKLLKILHLWTRLMSTNARSLTASGISQNAPDFQLGLEVEYSRWDMWMAYYATLSEILKRNLVYSPSYTETNPQILPPDSELSDQELQTARLRQRTELKSVESRIEAKLLEETSFPKANVRNEKVERWVDAVMENWRIMCGPNWTDEDLGEGGKNAIARGVLDILYRSATKTFHSTLILRHLFTVHAYLAEFELAMKALNTYLEMVTKARARAEKSTDPDFSLDENDKVLSTMSEAILLVCRYGTREDVENIRTTSGKLLLWVQQSEVRPEISEAARVNGVVIDPTSKSASPATIAEVYHALGVCEAQWARVTYEASSRSAHQNKALEHFRTALHRKYRQSKNLDYTYSYAVLMAEMRDINGAIKIVKQALAESSIDGPLAFDDAYMTERKLIRFWHLLTLLLSSRADILNAAKASNAAFEQFRDPGILFGQQEYRSEHLNESEKAMRPRSNALVDKMDTLEKTGILQVKMTQVALLESLEGPNSAVDASLDLLALYARLFGEAEHPSIAKATGPIANLPKSRVGSIRARFQRATSRRRRDTAKESSPTRPATSATLMAPKIQVTDLSAANETRGRTSNGIRPFSTAGPGEMKKHKTSRSLSRKGDRRHNSVQDSIDSFRTTSQATHYTDARSEISDTETNGTITNGRNSRQSMIRPSTSASTMTRSTMAWRGRSSKRESRYSMQTIDSDSATMAASQRPNPTSLIPNPSDKKLRMCLLVELWLFVAGMYRRSELFDDADDSIKEAEKLVSEIEMDAAMVSSSAKSFGDPGWGGAKSVDQLWGDVWSERGDLSRAQSLPHQAMERYERALGFNANHTGGIVGISDLLLDIYDEKMMPEADDTFPDYLSISTWNDGLDGTGSVTETSTIKGSISTSITSASALARAAATSNSASNSALAAARARETVSAPLSRTQTSGSIAIGSNASTPGPSLSKRAGSPQSMMAIMATSPPPEVATSRRPSVVPVASSASIPRSGASAASGVSVTSANKSIISDAQPSATPSASADKTSTEPSPEFLARLAARDRAYLLLSTLTKLGTGWDCSEAWFSLARAYEASGQVDKAKEVLWWCVELEDSKPLRNWGCVGVL